MTDLLEEEPGGVVKVLTGQWGNIGKEDIGDVLENIAGFIPGAKAFGASTGISAVTATWRAANRREKLEMALGLRDLDGYRKRSSAIEEGLDNIDAKKHHTIVGGAFGGLGGLGGMAGGAAIGSAIFPGIGTVAGTLIGGLVGGSAAGKLYSSVMEDKAEETLALTARIRLAQFEAKRTAQAAGQKIMNAGIPEEVVFATMVANLSKDKRAEVSKITGIKNFTELVENNDLDKLRKAMNNERVDDILRVDSGVFFFSAENPQESVAVQIAKKINSGEIDANELLLNQEQRLGISFLAEGNKLRGQGVTPVAADAPQELPPPGGSRGRV
jgi:hypothetical protein